MGAGAAAGFGFLGDMASTALSSSLQYDKQKLLFGIQTEKQKELMEEQRKQQMKMWRDTSYPTQMEMMKKAGINPALMYGMGGGGGQSTGGGMPGASMPSAPTYNMPSATEAMLAAAQIKVMESQAKKNEVEANKTAGVDTEKTIGEIGQIAAATGNTIADTKLKEVQTNILKIDEEIKGKTKKDAIDQIMWLSQKTMHDMQSIYMQNLVDNQTMDNRVKLVKEELAWKAVQVELGRAQIVTEKGKPALQAEELKVLEQQWKAYIRDGIQKWEQLRINGQQANTASQRQIEDAWINDMPKSGQFSKQLLEEVAELIIFKKIMTPPKK